MSAPTPTKLRNLSTSDALAAMHSPASGRSGGSGSGRGLASPGPISAVEPELLIDDDDGHAVGGDTKEREEAAQVDEEFSNSPPRKQQQQQPSNVQSSAVDEPASSDDDDASSAPRAAPKRYKTHLWHGVPAVLSQLAAGRALTTKLDAFLSAKAALDRSYAASLRKINSRWSSDLPVRPSAAEVRSTTAALVALRNSIDSTARNHEILADKLNEEIREKFMDEAEDREEKLEETQAEPQSKNACNELEQAMNALALAKKNVKQSCADLAAAQAQAAGLDPDDDGPASSPSRSDWMSDLVGGFALLGKKSSSVESLSKKVAKHDAAYIAAIKAVRKQRLEFDVEIADHLEAFERTELARAQSVLAVALGYTACHAACLASTLKNHQTIVTTLQTNIDPKQDVQAFIERTLRKTHASIEPPPLPVYRRFKGHPEYDPAANAASIQQQKRALKLKQKKLQQQAAQQQQKAHRSKNDSEEELSLSEATDSDNENSGDDDDDPADVEDDLDNDDSVPFSPPPQQLSSPAEQLDAEAAFTQLFASLLRPAGGVEANTISPVSPSSLQTDLAAATERLKTPAGRAAMASVLKRSVNAAASAPTVAASSVDAPSELSAEHGLHAVEPTIATHSPVAVADASAPAVLTLSAASFEHLATLCLRLLDQCEANLHATPAISVLRVSRRILLQPAAQGAESLLQEESLTPVSLLSRLRAHHATSSLRLWELSFFESLSAARLKHAPLHPWQTEQEHREQDAVSRGITARLIRKYAEEMQAIAPAVESSASSSSASSAAASGITDDQLIAFVDKFAAMHNLDAATIQELIASVPAFARRGVTQLPSVTRAALAINTSSVSSKGKAKGMPIALPVNSASASTAAAAGVSPSSNRSDPALSPLASAAATHHASSSSKGEFQGELENLEVVDDMSEQ